MATRIINFPQITAAFIVANNPSGVRQVLSDNGYDLSGIVSDKGLAQFLYSIYLTKGSAEFIRLVQLVPLNRSANNWTTDRTRLQPTLDDLSRLGFVSTSPTQRADWFNEVWKGLVGGSTTQVAPTVTTTTKASPVTIGLIIGGVLVLGIIAYVVVKS